MKSAKDVVVDWIQAILDRKNWTGTDLARKASLSPSTILRLLNDEKYQFVPSMKTLGKISEASNLPIPSEITELLRQAQPATSEEKKPSSSSRSHAAATVDLRYFSALPTSLQSTTGSKRTGQVAVPPQLKDDDTAFGFYMPDDSLDPWFKAGSLMFASKSRDPIAGDILVVTDKSGRARVRILVGLNENGLTLSKSMPAKDDEKIGFDDIGELAIVMVAMKTA
jgi:transcriptional regulator with XRE-family HTH domain